MRTYLQVSLLLWDLLSPSLGMPALVEGPQASSSSRLVRLELQESKKNIYYFDVTEINFPFDYMDRI